MSGTRLAFMRPFTTRLFNPISRHVAGRLPWFGIIGHRGRKTGTIHRAPINVFRAGDAWVVALTYGSDVDWVKNVLAAGGCTLETRGRTYELGQPELIVDPARRLMPPPVRFFLGLLGVSSFLRMRTIEPHR